jgi:glycolate oxidase iron-sulfur subunit
VKEYGRALAHDPAYADKAARIGALTRDLSELLPALVPLLRPKLQQAAGAAKPRLAYHPPCSLQHGQQLRGEVEAGLSALGFEIRQASCDSHLCCGSAGTYSVLQPALAQQLRDRKLQALAPIEAQTIVSGNIGCIQHLQSGTATPVRHWIEVLDDALR